MDPHFCSTCGVACSGPTSVVEEGDAGGDEVELAALDTVNHALDVIGDMVAEEEETERVEAVADATVDVVEAEADATVDVIEALTEGEPEVEEESTDGDDGVDDDGGVDEPAAEGGEDEAVEEGEEEDGTGEATPVNVPPQLEDEATGKRPEGQRTTSAFRKRRMKRR